MKKLSRLKSSIVITLIALLFCNILVFLKSIKLADEINKFEREITRLHQENAHLENKVYSIDSLQYASSLAAELNFSEKAEPILLDELKYARNQ